MDGISVLPDLTALDGLSSSGDSFVNTPDAGGSSNAPAVRPIVQQQPSLQSAGAIVPPDVPGNHAKLMSMLLGLSVGTGAFGKAIATGGREGGVDDVIRFKQAQAQEQRAQEDQAMKRQQFELNSKYLTAQTNMKQLEYQVALANAPLDFQMKAIQAQAASIALWKSKGLSPVFAVNFVPGQSMQEHGNGVMAGMQNHGLDPTNSVVIPEQTGAGHGEAGQSLVYRASDLDKVTATKEEYAPTLAVMKGQVDNAAAALGEQSPIVQLARNQIEVLSRASSISAAQDAFMNVNILGPLTQAMNDKKQGLEVQQAQLGVQKTQQDIAATGPVGADKATQQTKINETLYHVYNPGKALPEQFTIKPTDTAKDIERISGGLKELQSAQQDKFNQAQESYRAMQNRAAQTANELQKKGIEDLTKMWSDPQHGYVQFLSEANATKAAIASAKNGSQLAASLEPVMLAQGVSAFAGIHRINETEVSHAGPQVGSVYRRINAMLDKAGSGSIPEDTIKEASDLVNQLIDARHGATVQASQLLTNNYKLDPASVSIFTRDGNIDTVQHVSGGSAQDRELLDKLTKKHLGGK